MAARTPATSSSPGSTVSPGEAPSAPTHVISVQRNPRWYVCVCSSPAGGSGPMGITISGGGDATNAAADTEMAPLECASVATNTNALPAPASGLMRPAIVIVARAPSPQPAAPVEHVVT